MNIARLSALLLFTMMLIPIGASAHCKGKHTGNHEHCSGGDPPPPPPVESCADATGVFPSFAYSTDIHDGKHGTLSGHDLFLANSDGDCSIKIHTNNATDWLNVSYRQDGSQGRLVWSQSEETGLGRRSNDKGKPVVKMLDITVVDGELASSSLSTVYMHPTGTSVAIFDAELSPDGNTIFYSFEGSDGSGGWVDSIHSIDVSSCSSGCASQIIAGPGQFGASRLSMNSSGQRLYFSGSTFGIGFLEVTGMTFSAIRTVASVTDPEYVGSQPYDISVGSWDFDGDGSANDVVAISLDNVQTVDILDVTQCSVSPSPISCLASGDSSIIRTGIPGENMDFQAEDLLIDNVNDIGLLDTDSLSPPTVLLQGNWPDSAN